MFLFLFILCESVEDCVRLQAHTILHTLTTQARLRARQGEETPFEKPYPFGSSYFILYKVMLRCIGHEIRPGFLREGFYHKTEVKWKLHQEGDAGTNQCHQHSPAIPEARQDERLCVLNPLHTTTTPTRVGILAIQSCWNVKRAGRQADFENISSNIEFFY